MTYNEALAQLKCGIRFKVAGALVHSVDIPYYNSDGTPAADNIDLVPYSATFQHGGKTITIRVAHEGSSVGAANPRRYTVTADAPFWCSYTCMLGHGIITTSQTYPYDYGIIYDARLSPKHRTFGDDTSDYNCSYDETGRRSYGSDKNCYCKKSRTIVQVSYRRINSKYNWL